MNSIEIEEFCKQMPKAELHAHLNGSLSPGTLQILNCSKEDVAEYQKLTSLLGRGEKNLSECFSLFRIAQNATNSPSAVYLAAKHVIEEFFDDNVIYLELRTTPRSEAGMTKKEYIEAVVRAIQDNKNDIVVKLLLSIDRRHDLEVSEDNLKLFIEMKKEYPEIIRGVDLSGDPSIGQFEKDLFKLLDNSGLFLTIHCAEVASNPDEVEDILSFRPDRIGHATFLHPKFSKNSSNNWDIYRKNPIPAEFCLTSNVLCGTSEGYKEHHVKEWMENNLPFTIGTDDKGVFDTTLSKELFHISSNFNLTATDLLKITSKSIEYCFASDVEKSALLGKVERWEMENR